jgi:AbrB family looped-hinge helix DNA binding protein
MINGKINNKQGGTNNMEESTMTSKGQIVVPAKLRRRYGLKPGTKVYFIERDDEILFQPVTKQFIRSVHGMLKSETSVTKELLKERAREKEQEEVKFEKHGAR